LPHEGTRVKPPKKKVVKKVKKKRPKQHKPQYKYIMRDGQGNWRVQIRGWKYKKKFKKRGMAAKWADIILIQSGEQPVNKIDPKDKKQYYNFNIGVKG